MRRVAGLSTGGKSKRSRSLNDLARRLIKAEPPLGSAIVRGWLAEMAEADCISLLDEQVLRAFAKSRGVAAT